MAARFYASQCLEACLNLLTTQEIELFAVVESALSFHLIFFFLFSRRQIPKSQHAPRKLGDGAMPSCSRCEQGIAFGDSFTFVASTFLYISVCSPGPFLFLSLAQFVLQLLRLDDIAL